MPPAFEYSAMLSHLLKLSEVQFPQRVNCKNTAAGCSRFALRQFCQAQHLSEAKQRSGQKLTQKSKASCIACSNNSTFSGKLYAAKLTYRTANIAKATPCAVSPAGSRARSEVNSGSTSRAFRFIPLHAFTRFCCARQTG